MALFNKNVIPILLSLLIVGAISWVLYFQQATEHDTVRIANFPKTLGTWTAEDLPISKEDLAILETDNAFARRYTNSVDNAQLYLYIVYSQSNRKVAHPPEICYTGSGLTIAESVHDPIPVTFKNMTIQTNRLRLTKKDFNHFSYYWFKVGDKFTANYWQQQVLLAINSLTGKSTSSALVRVSIDIEDGDQQKASQSVKSFVNLMASDLFSYLP